MKVNKIFRQLVITLILIFIFSALLMKKMNSRIKSIGQIFPAQELKIFPKFPDNLLIEHWYSDKTECCIKRSYNFDRGDIVQLNFSEITPGAFIKQNETIGVIHSATLEKELSSVEGELNQAKALLASQQTGEKASVIQTAEEQVKAKETKLADQKNILQRMKELKKSNLVSVQEYESAENYLHVLEIEVMVAKSRLSVVKTGEKQEALQITKEKIASLTQQLKHLKKQNSDYTITSPFSGSVNLFTDSLITLSGQSQLYVNFPVKLARRNEIAIGQEIEIELPDIRKKAKARVSNIDPNVRIISGNQIFWVKGKLDQATLPVGSIVKCRVKCDSEALYKTILKMFKYIEIN